MRYCRGCFENTVERVTVMRRTWRSKPRSDMRMKCLQQVQRTGEEGKTTRSVGGLFPKSCCKNQSTRAITLDLIRNPDHHARCFSLSSTHRIRNENPNGFKIIQWERVSLGTRECFHWPMKNEFVTGRHPLAGLCQPCSNAKLSLSFCDPATIATNLDQFIY